MEHMIDISSIDKAELLAGLYNNSRPLGLGFLHYTPKDMTTEEARKIIEEEGLSFDYLHGRVMKVNLKLNSFNPCGYDRDNGKGSAAKVVKQIRDRL